MGLHLEVVVTPEGDVVALPEDVLGLRFCAIHRLFGAGRDEQHVDAPRGRGRDARAVRADGDEEAVVLILAEHGRPARLRDAHHAVRGAADPDDAANGVQGAEEVVGHGGAQHADLRLEGLVVVDPEAAPGDLELADPEVRQRGPIQGRLRIAIGVDHLAHGLEKGRHAGHADRVPRDGATVALGEPSGGLAARAGRLRRLGKHEERIGAEAVDLAADLIRRAGPEGRHRDDRRHADEDAQHGERGARLVAADGPEGRHDGVPPDDHARTRGAAGRTTDASDKRR